MPHIERAQPTSKALRTSWRLLTWSIREYLEFDSPAARLLVNYLGLSVGAALYLFRRERQGFNLLSKLHRSNYGAASTCVAERAARGAIRHDQGTVRSVHLRRELQQYIENQSPQPHTRRYFEQPEKLLGTVAMVLKAPQREGKGVIVILYSYVIPLFAKLFDVRKIAKDYVLVLEPSWSGYCNWDVLCYGHMDAPVLVQANEPRDYEFIQGLEPRFWPVRLSNNSWVDHRIFRPIPGTVKDVDLIMVAGWADFKRHHRVFKALKTLRERGRRLKTILIGYPMNQSRELIMEDARYYGVQDQLEVYESLTAEEVNRQLNRAKVNIIWSRKEGVNRAIVEGMFAGVPCLVREGFNYGYRYPHINPQTGCYASDADLPDKLLWMTENAHGFDPRAWVETHMTCQQSTEILTRTIETSMAKVGEPWSGRLAIKVNGLHGMQYWDPHDREGFAREYAYLASCIRTGKPV